MTQANQGARRSSRFSLRALVLATGLTGSIAVRGRQLERRQTIDVPESEPTLKRSNAIVRRGRCISFNSPLSPTVNAQELEDRAQPRINPQVERPQPGSSHVGVSPHDLTGNTQILDLPFRPRHGAPAPELNGQLYDVHHPANPALPHESTRSQGPTNDTPVDWDLVRRLPQLLATWAQEGKSASSIGRLLHEHAYGQDRSLVNLVTIMVNQQRPYHEIGRSVLRNLDLRNDRGNPLYLDVPVGDPSLIPSSSRAQLSLSTPYGTDDCSGTENGGDPSAEMCESPLSYEHPDTLGPRMICPKPTRASQVRWPFFEDEESLEAFLAGAEDDEEAENIGEDLREVRSRSLVAPTPYHPPRGRRPRYVVPECIPYSCAASIHDPDSDRAV